MFLNVTDSQLLEADSPVQEHVLSEEWKETAPACTAAFDPDAANGADAQANVFAPEMVTDTINVDNTQAARLTVGFEQAEKCDGYEIWYASNAGMLPADQVETESVSFVIEGLKSGKDYYIRVRPYRWDSKGEKLYGTFSKKVKVTVL